MIDVRQVYKMDLSRWQRVCAAIYKNAREAYAAGDVSRARAEQARARWLFGKIYWGWEKHDGVR